MDGGNGTVRILPVNEYGNFNFAGGDHLDVDARLTQRLEHGGGHTGVGLHARTHDGYLGNGIVPVHIGSAERLLMAFQYVHCGVLVRQRHGKADVLGAVAPDGLQDNVHVDPLG